MIAIYFHVSVVASARSAHSISMWLSFCSNRVFYLSTHYHIKGKALGSIVSFDANVSNQHYCPNQTIFIHIVQTTVISLRHSEPFSATVKWLNSKHSLLSFYGFMRCQKRETNYKQGKPHNFLTTNCIQMICSVICSQHKLQVAILWTLVGIMLFF